MAIVIYSCKLLIVLASVLKFISKNVIFQNVLAYFRQQLSTFIVATAAYLPTTVNYSCKLLIAMAYSLKLVSKILRFQNMYKSVYLLWP